MNMPPLISYLIGITIGFLIGYYYVLEKRIKGEKNE
jgi:hypothetical protein